MRQIALIFLGLIAVNAVFVHKVNDPNAPVFAEMEDIDNTEMGRKLFDTIALQLKNKSPLSDIARMLQNLRENLVLQQQDADLQHAADEADCEAEITGYNRRIDFASNEIEESTTEINQLTTAVENLEVQIQNIGAQLDILNQQEEVLRTSRAKAAQDFVVRQQQSQEVIEALDVIAQKLGAIQPNGDNAAVFLELEKMGGSNPILALVQLASSFSADQLTNVQQKISELRASMAQAIIDDQDNETQEQVDFQTLLSQFADQRDNLSNSRNEASQKLNDSQNALGLQRRRNEDAGAELTTATAGKAQKEAECESQRTLHARDTEHRQKEVGIIRQVEGVLATKLEGASSYLEQRVNTQQ